MAGDWWISIVPAGEPPSYRRSSTDFAVGDQVITATLTGGEGRYDVKIIVYPFESMVLDKVIEVR